MNLQTFQKTAVSTEQQITLLQDKGLDCLKQDKCKLFLQQTPFYKLSGYWLHLKNTNQKDKSFFIPGSSLDNVIKAYELDLEVRSVIFNLLSYYEIMLKNSFINLSLSINNTDIAPNVNSHFYLSDSLFTSDFYPPNFEKLKTDIENNLPRFEFLNNYKKKYDTPYYPPVWMVTELMSFGDISKWISFINRKDYMDIIAKKFGYKKRDEFNNTNIILTNLRNMCAHHSRLYQNNIYGKRGGITINILQNILNNKGKENKLWNSLILLIYGLHNTGHKNQIKESVQLLTGIFSDTYYPEKMYINYSFPNNWTDKIDQILTI